MGINPKSIDNMAEKLFVTLFKILARPIPKYGQSVRTPRLTTLSQEVEGVPRSATVILRSLKKLRNPDLP